MPTFKDMSSLLTYIQKMVMEVAKTDCVDVIEDKQIQHNQSDVYGVYNPKIYNRDYALIDKNNFEVQDVDSNTIKIVNIAKPSPSVVDGYDSSKYQLQWLVEEGASPAPFGEGVWTGERSAVENTFNELNNSSEVINAMRSGLKKRGITVK